MKPKTNSEIVLYQAADGKTRLEVQFQGETAWLSQAQMAELFQTTIPNVSMHLRNVFAEGELQADSVIQEFLTNAADGNSQGMIVGSPGGKPSVFPNRSTRSDLKP
jgi:hypothetical protein